MRTSWTVVLVVALAAAAGCSEDEDKQGYRACTDDADCGDEVCHHGGCVSSDPATLGDPGAPCTTIYQCRSFVCTRGECAPGTRKGGERCIFDEECAGGSCEGKVCAAVELDAGPDQQLTPDAGPDAADPDAGTPDAAIDRGVDAPPSDQGTDAPQQGDLAGVEAGVEAGAEAGADLPAGEGVPACGNNVIEGTEVCDGSALAGKACTDFGYLGGILLCNAGCTGYLTKGCLSLPDPFGGFAVASSSTDAETFPAVGSDGTGWLVTYHQNGKLMGRFVDAGGTMGKPAFTIGTSASQHAVVSYTGSKYLVLWYNASKIKRALVDATGAVTGGGDALTVSSWTQQLSGVRVGAYTLLAWTNYNNVRYARLDSGGLSADGPSGKEIVPGTTGQQDPAVASDGTRWLVAWVDTRNSPNYEIYGNIVTLGGAKLLSKDLPIATGGGKRGYPAAAWDGSGYYVAWNRTVSKGVFRVDGVQVTKAGAVLGAIKTIYPGPHDSRPFGASGASDILLLSQRIICCWDRSIHLTRLSPPQVELDLPVALPESINQQAAWGKDHYLMVWEKNNNIHAARFK
jgi:hypothetical protein